jgi:Na+-transporting methylmalonyl-CoA/oxaloacetate decarboxylase gamma subunit
MMPAPPLDARGVRLEGSEPSLSLVHLFASVSKLYLNITCISCTSPGMDELATLLSTPEAIKDATEVANDVFEYVTRILDGEFLQVTFDRMLNDAKMSCPHSPSYTASPNAVKYEPFQSSDSTDQSIQFLIYLAIGTVCLIAFVSTVAIIVKLVVRRRHRKWLRSLSSERVYLVWQQQRADQQKEMKLNEQTRSLFTSPQIPRWVRLIMPVVILGNIGFFLSGHLSLGATVNIEATLAGQPFTVGNFFEFSMAFSIVEIWNAGGKELAIMILLFSGVWPYTKQVITLALWFLPPASVSVSKRGSIFLWLDALAKWSMVDIFVLVITVAGFRVSVQSPNVGFLPEDFYSLDLLVVPLWGLYANMIAQLISQISSHCIVYYHRKIVAEATERHEESLQLKNTETFIIDDDEEEESTPFASTKLPLSIQVETKDKLALHAFARPHRGERDKLVARRGVNLMLIGVALVMSVLVILGCVLPAFSQEILGIIGVMVESGQDFKQANKEHSLFSIIGMFFEQARFTGRAADFVGLGSLAALLVFTVLIVPVVQGGVLLYQWFRPMTRKTRGRVAVLLEILQAWQYAEVFLLAIVIASW